MSGTHPQRYTSGTYRINSVYNKPIKESTVTYLSTVPSYGEFTKKVFEYRVPIPDTKRSVGPQY
jgi:hypothetical protein